jgi:glycolate oxidase FAD binding subunit
MEFVTGAGVISKSGGRVVKNVTGYDIHQLLAGSLGTLAVITRVNFKTLPLPSEERIFVARFRSHDGSLAFCTAIASSQLQPRMVEVASGLAAGIVGSSHLKAVCWNVAVGGAGNRAVVLRYEHDLSRMASEHGASDFVTLDGANKDDVFVRIREFPRLLLETHPHAAILRIAILPGSMPDFIDKVFSIAESSDVEAAILVRAVGVVYAALRPRQKTGSLQLAAPCRALMEAAIRMGARPLIEFCPADLKSEVNVWPPLGSEESLVRKLKNVFDPQGVLAPGRFQGGL